MPRKPKTTPTATTTTSSIPFPVDNPFVDKVPITNVPMNEQEEEHRHFMNMNYRMDWEVREGDIIPADWKGPPIRANRVNEIQVPSAETNMPADSIPSAPFPLDEALMLEQDVCEVSLEDLIEEQKLSREEEIPSQSTVTPALSPDGTTTPLSTGPRMVHSKPVPTTPPESTLPKITRHKGQRVQTVKTIYTQVPIQYRTALDRLKEKTRKSLKEVICEAIGLCAVKHGVASTPGSIMGWADWD
jgi:hypothetical protein